MPIASGNACNCFSGCSNVKCKSTPKNTCCKWTYQLPRLWRQWTASTAVTLGFYTKKKNKKKRIFDEQHSKKNMDETLAGTHIYVLYSQNVCFNCRNCPDNSVSEQINFSFVNRLICLIRSAGLSTMVELKCWQQQDWRELWVPCKVASGTRCSGYSISEMQLKK